MQLARVLIPGLLLFAVACGETTPGDPSSEAKPHSTNTESPPLADPPQLLSSDEIAAGWISLFDGQTLFGWKANSDMNCLREDWGLSVLLLSR